MNAQRVDLLIKYALAVAAEEDHPYDRELRPIHLIKYCYLADLAYARDHQGRSYTGADWQFYHFGPWSRDLFLRVDPAAREIGAEERHFSTARQEDAVSWSLKQKSVSPESLEAKLPADAASAIKRAVHEFGSDTVSLLHYVYTTEPMLNAAPGEQLDLSKAQVEEVAQVAGASESDALRPPQLSKTAIKKLRNGVQERFRTMKERRSANPAASPVPPPYDEIFIQGQAWLDSLAGEELIEDEGRVSFAESIWKSGGRREPKLP